MINLTGGLYFSWGLSKFSCFFLNQFSMDHASLFCSPRGNVFILCTTHLSFISPPSHFHALFYPLYFLLFHSHLSQSFIIFISSHFINNNPSAEVVLRSCFEELFWRVVLKGCFEGLWEGCGRVKGGRGSGRVLRRGEKWTVGIFCFFFAMSVAPRSQKCNKDSWCHALFFYKKNLACMADL